MWLRDDIYFTVHSLATKLKQISEDYEARESVSQLVLILLTLVQSDWTLTMQQYEKILKHKQLEVQLVEAKMAQQTVSAAEDKETSLTERRMLLAESLEQQKRCEELTQQEAELRGQLSLYSDKFEEFQKTLTKSNQMFSTFKKEMDKVGVAFLPLTTCTVCLCLSDVQDEWYTGEGDADMEGTLREVQQVITGDGPGGVLPWR